MPHPFDDVIPKLLAVAFIALFVGQSLALALLYGETAATLTLNKIGMVLVLAGAATFCATSVAVAVADAYSVRAEVHARSDAAHGGAPHAPADDDHDAVAVALDHPAAALNLVASTLIVSAVACFAAATFGAGEGVVAAARVVFVVGCGVGLAAPLLGAVAEAHRTHDVAELARELMSRGTPPPGVLCDALDRLEARHGGAARAPAGARLARCALCRPPHAAARTRPSSCGAFVAAASPLVAAAEVLNVTGAAALFAASVALLCGAGVAAAVLLECAFALFAAASVLVLRVGARKVAAHRRGGRAHLERDVRRTLEQWR